MWHIEYSGKSFFLKDHKGCRYIHLLLDHPGRELSATQMVLTAARKTSALRQVSDEEAEESGLTVASEGPRDELFDNETKKRLSHRIAELRAEIVEFKRKGEIDKATTAEHELRQLNEYLNSGVGLGGGPRWFQDQMCSWLWSPQRQC